MAGKYSHITPHLPKFVGNDAGYQAKVQETKQLILEAEGVTWLPASRLTQDYVALRDEVDMIKAQLSDANLRLEAVSQMLQNQFEVEGVGSLTVSGVGNVRLQTEPYAQVKDKEVFRQWCINTCSLCGTHKDKHADADHRPMTLESSLALPWQTTNSTVKELLLAGQPEPDGIECFQKTTPVLTRAK